MFALAAAAPAMAGTASVTGGTLSYVAAPGETNTVTVTQSGNSFTIADTTATITSDAGCLGTGSETICTDASPIQSVKVDLRDANDVVTLSTSVASELLGRVGNDQLTGGAGPDRIDGGVGADVIDTVGPGRDTVQCDAEDTSVTTDPDDNISGGCLPAAPQVLSGPNGPTNDNTPSFSFATSPGAPVTGFECMIDPVDTGPFGCDSPYEEASELPDGPYLFRVRAVNSFGAGAWSSRSFRVDTQAPQIIVTGPPGTPAQPTFQIASTDESAPVSFECAVDEEPLAPCGSQYTAPVTANGSYLLFVKGTDAAGNSTTSEIPFTVQVSPGGGGGGGGGTTPPPAVQPSKIIIESLVLISGRPVRMTRKRTVSIRLQCAGTNTCKGRMSISTAEPVKRRSRKLERLGSARFSIAANKAKNVKVRFSKKKARLAKKLKRFKAKVVITEIDKRGNPRVSSRVFILRAR
jgi:hypothetical protein